jgi:hypothetical protein
MRAHDLKVSWLAMATLALALAAGNPPGHTVVAADAQPIERVLDALWVWGNPELTEPGSHDAASFAQASPAQRARILGVPNVFMAGTGLPHDRKLAAQWNAEVAGSPRLVWEMLADGDEEHGSNFVFKQRTADLAPLVKKYPQIEAVLID